MNVEIKRLLLLYIFILLSMGINSNAKTQGTHKKAPNSVQKSVSTCSFWKGLQWGTIINYESDMVDENYVKDNALLYDVNFVISTTPLNEEPEANLRRENCQYYVYYSFMMPDEEDALKVWKRQYSYVDKEESEIILEPFATTKSDSINPFDFGMSYKKANDQQLYLSSLRVETEGITSNGINGLWKMQHYNMVFVPVGTFGEQIGEKLGGLNLEKEYKYLEHFKSKDKGIMYIYYGNNRTTDLVFTYWIEDNKVFLLNKGKHYLMVLPYNITENGKSLNYIITKNKMPKSLVKYIEKSQLKKNK